MNRKTIIFLAVFLPLFILSSLHAKIEKGPYLQNVTQNSITLCWQTTNKAEGKVLFGTTEELGLEAKDTSAQEFHEVTLTNLATSTLYYYKIESDSESTKIYKFKTAKRADEPFTFTAYGDFREGIMETMLIKRMIRENPDFVLVTGDMMSDGRELALWDGFFRVVGSLMKTIPYYPSFGNHENDSPLYFKYFSLPDNERYYSFDYGNSHFIILDSDSPYVMEIDQKKWLIKDLEAHRDAQFTFAVFHHPPYTSRDRGGAGARNFLCPTLEKYGVDVVLNGHNHFYERVKKNGVMYVITGGGGASLYDFGDDLKEGILAQEKDYHFVKVSIDGKHMKLEAKKSDGKVFDTFELNK